MRFGYSFAVKRPDGSTDSRNPNITYYSGYIDLDKEPNKGDIIYIEDGGLSYDFEDFRVIKVKTVSGWDVFFAREYHPAWKAGDLVIFFEDVEERKHFINIEHFIKENKKRDS